MANAETQKTEYTWQEIHQLAVLQLDYIKQISKKANAFAFAPAIPAGMIDDDITDPWERFNALTEACTDRLKETFHVPIRTQIPLGTVKMGNNNIDLSSIWDVKLSPTMDLMIAQKITGSARETEDKASVINQWCIDPTGNFYILRNDIREHEIMSPELREAVKNGHDAVLAMSKTIMVPDSLNKGAADIRTFDKQSQEPFEDIDLETRYNLIAERFIGQVAAIGEGEYKTHIPRNWSGNVYVGSAAMMLNMTLAAHPDWSPVFLTAEQISSLGLNFIGNPVGTRIMNKDNFDENSMSSVVYNINETDFILNFPRHAEFACDFIEANRKKPKDATKALNAIDDNMASFIEGHSCLSATDDAQKSVLTKLFSNLSLMRMNTVNNGSFRFEGFSDEEIQQLRSIPSKTMLAFINHCGHITEAIVNEFKLNTDMGISMDAINVSVNNLIEKEQEQSASNSPKIK